MKHKVVITGLGAICPIGNNANNAFASAVDGVCGIDVATKFDTQLTGITAAGEVKDLESVLPISKREAKRLDLFTQYALTAALEAWNDAGVHDGDMDTHRIGVVLGSGMGGLETICEQDRLLMAQGAIGVSAMFIPKTIINIAAGNIAIKLSLHGPCYGLVSACSSGTDAIGHAYYAIKEGRLDGALTGGTEAVLTNLAIQGFHQMQALSESTDPKRASIPFDEERQGFVMGEGASFLFLESEESAKKRNARIYGEIVGFGQTCDAYHVTAPLTEGTYAAKAMELAVLEAGIQKEQVGYINAHGTGTPLNDSIETTAIKKCFGEHSKNLLVSSTKSMTAHMLGAAGALEALLSVKALNAGIALPTIGLIKEGEGCDLDYVKGKSRPMSTEYALSNSFGFGGHNSSLLIKKGE
ncbi:MAG TPA: beta-ketoacyl-[acyl-carrier-protein] synthase II [Clostridiales bacterium]|nr:beta-ketoacyl-[acyl-carrier-protein] synthase II [Clostridiales bacterium]